MATTYFSDTFPGTTLNTANWNPYFFNNDDEWPQTNNQLLMSNVIVSNSLYLEVNKGAPDGQPYSGAMINCYNKAASEGNTPNIEYGWIQLQAVFPWTANNAGALGHWAGMSLYSTDCVDTGVYKQQTWELDVEWVGSDPTAVYMTLHYFPSNFMQQFRVSVPTYYNAHDYTFHWSPTYCQALFDGNVVGTFSMVPNMPMFNTLFHVVDDGNWPGNTPNANTQFGGPVCSCMNYFAVQNY